MSTKYTSIGHTHTHKKKRQQRSKQTNKKPSEQKINQNTNTTAATVQSSFVILGASLGPPPPVGSRDTRWYKLFRLICCSNYQSKKIELIFAEGKSSYMGTIKFEFNWLVMLLEQNMPNLY